MRDLPLVLLHAYPLDARMWNPVRGRFAERTRLITPDQRGLGRAPLPATDAEPSLGHAARDVVALLDELGLDKVNIGGCSMGGYVTAAVARTAPERIGGLVLVDTKATADTDAARSNRLAVAQRADAEGIDGWLAEEMLPNLLGATTRSTRPGLVAEVRDSIERQRPAGVAWAQRAMAARVDSTEVLRSLDVPSLVIVGEQDTITPPAVARDLADTLPRSELVVLPDAGHLTPLEAPDGVVAAVLRVLG